MGKALIDSNVIIDYLGRTLPVPGIRFISSESKKGFAVSIITSIELVGSRAIKEDTLQIRNFLSNATVIPVDENVGAKAIQIRQRQPIKLADSIIAATALVHDLTLITRNIRDFKSIPHLKLVNAWLKHVK